MNVFRHIGSLLLVLSCNCFLNLYNLILVGYLACCNVACIDIGGCLKDYGFTWLQTEMERL